VGDAEVVGVGFGERGQRAEYRSLIGVDIGQRGNRRR
jgi:hypothetical protein